MKAEAIIKEFRKRSRALTQSELIAEKRYSPTSLKVRKISKSDYQFLLKSKLSHLDEHEQARLWLEVYHLSPYRNLDSIVIDFFKMRSKRKSFNIVDYADDIYEMVDKIDCWMTGDMLANLTSLIHEREPRKFAPILDGWSKSQKPWIRRMALLSLFYYSRCRSHYPAFNQAVGLLRRNLNSDHYYVQKSVGWTIRELHNVYPEKTKKWISKNLDELSSYAFTTATEKISGKIKDQWKNQRRLSRKKLKYSNPNGS